MTLSYPVSMVLISIFISLLFIRCLCECCCYKLNEAPIYNTLSITKAPKESSKPDSSKSEYIAIV